MSAKVGGLRAVRFGQLIVKKTINAVMRAPTAMTARVMGRPTRGGRRTRQMMIAASDPMMHAIRNTKAVRLVSFTLRNHRSMSGCPFVFLLGRAESYGGLLF